jgi:hypothetical protein
LNRDRRSKFGKLPTPVFESWWSARETVKFARCKQMTWTYGTTIRWGPWLPCSLRYARKLITWIVFPRPKKSMSVRRVIFPAIHTHLVCQYAA